MPAPELPTRTVAIFSTSRGDARGLSTVASRLMLHSNVRLRVMVTETAAPGWAWLPPSDRTTVETVHTGLVPGAGSLELLRAAHELATMAMDFLTELPAVVLVMGDRHELLPLLHTVLLRDIPIGHLSGGEITEGAFDDAVRHAVSKLSHLHFCTTEEAARRVRQMGEEPWRVHVTGEPALDRLLDEAEELTAREVARGLGVDLVEPFAILTYHPPTSHPELSGSELESCLEAAALFPLVIATYPSAEPGAAEIITRLERWQRGRPGALLVEHLGAGYPGLLKAAAAVIGNSSSGVVEAATFGCPVIDVGDRQKGRMRGANVLHAPGNGSATRAAASRVVEPDFVASLVGLVNPYGDGHAATRIAEVVAMAEFTSLVPKKFIDTASR